MLVSIIFIFKSDHLSNGHFFQEVRIIRLRGSEARYTLASYSIIQ